MNTLSPSSLPKRILVNGENPLKDLTIKLDEYRVVVQYEKSTSGAREY